MTDDWLIKAYAMSCMTDVETIREYDAVRYSDPDEGFRIWRSARLQEFRSAQPDAFVGDVLADEPAFVRHCTGFGLMVSATWGHA